MSSRTPPNLSLAQTLSMRCAPALCVMAHVLRLHAIRGALSVLLRADQPSSLLGAGGCKHPLGPAKSTAKEFSSEELPLPWSVACLAGVVALGAAAQHPWERVLVTAKDVPLQSPGPRSLRRATWLDWAVDAERCCSSASLTGRMCSCRCAPLAQRRTEIGSWREPLQCFWY